MTTPKGGRGKKAPYKTQQMRVPIPIKDQVNILITKFRNGIFENLETDKKDINLTLLPELKKLQDEIEDLKAALEESDQQIDNLNTALVNAQLKIQELNLALEEERHKFINLSTGIIQRNVMPGQNISEGEARKLFNISRETLRNPREKGQIKVSFEHNNKLIELEYIGQPEGKGTPHYWKVAKIEDTQSTLSLLN